MHAPGHIPGPAGRNSSQILNSGKSARSAARSSSVAGISSVGLIPLLTGLTPISLQAGSHPTR